MQNIKDVLEERLEDVVKVLLVITLFLTLIIVVFIYKGRNEEEGLENEIIDELFLEQEQEETTIEIADSVNSEDVELGESQKIIIDVKGAVEAPGVYEMESGSRVIDCIEKAGGFLIDAEQKSVNLAQRTEDQMVIFIPLKGEDISEFEQLLPDKPVGQSTTAKNKLDLNKATKEELKSLNGIGDTKAESIIEYRETNGSFQRVEDITKVSGIGDATFEKLKEEIQVFP